PTVESTKYFDINRIITPIHNNGIFARHPITGNTDFYFDDNGVIYASGLWFGAKVNGEIRTSASDFNTDFVGGVIDNDGNPRGRDKQIFRVLKINLGDNKYNNIDYAEWPFHYGAPEDKQGNPRLFGDQTLWCSYTDSYDENRDYNVCPPLGAEIHQLIWGWKKIDNIMFVRWEIINKNKDVWENAYFGLFSDPDVMNATNDLVCSDSTLSLVCCYDASVRQFMLPVHAVGYILLESPSFYAPGDTAQTLFGIKPDFKNVPIYSPKMGKSTPDGFQDPPYRSERTAQILYNRLRCFDRDGEPAIDPTTGKPTNWAFSGDPITGLGWLEQPTYSRDRRMMLSMGPLNMARGDTAFITAAIIPVQRHKNTTCIFNLKQEAKAVQSLFRNEAGLFSELVFAEAGQDSVVFPICLMNVNKIKRIEFTIDEISESQLLFLEVKSAARTKNFNISSHKNELTKEIEIVIEAADTLMNVGKDKIAEITLKLPAFVDTNYVDFKIKNVFIYADNDKRAKINSTTGTMKITDSILPVQLQTPTENTFIDRMKIEFSWKDEVDSNTYVIDVFSDNFKLSRQTENNFISIPIREFISGKNYSSIKDWTVTIDNHDLLVFSPDTFNFHLPSKESLINANPKFSLTLPNDENLSYNISKYFVQEPFIYLFLWVYDKINQKSYGQVDVVKIIDDSFETINSQTIDEYFNLIQVDNTNAYFCFDDTLSIYSINENKQFVYEDEVLLDMFPSACLLQDSLLMFVGWKDENRKLMIYKKSSSSMMNKESEFDITSWNPDNSYLPLEKIMVLDNNYLFLSYVDWGIFNLTEPDKIKLISRTNIPGRATTIAYENEKIHVGNNNNRIIIYDVRSKETPVKVYEEQLGDYKYANSIINIEVINEYIYFESQNYNYPGYQMCHHEPGKCLVLDGLFETRKPLITRQLLYGVNDEYNSLTVYENQISTNTDVKQTNNENKFRLFQNYPNPFNNSTKINFYLNKGNKINLEIFNIKGQKVKTLVNGFKEAGEHRIIWDGTNDVGTIVSTGLFLYQLRCGEKTSTKKIVYLK
ncbi:MAG: T9SS type A sorting domain-containing protein, partial [Bacteroidales bacterium]|nr:T9SS type A sorting domain-containing protein [Bacteroidales bacterium]